MKRSGIMGTMALLAGLLLSPSAQAEAPRAPVARTKPVVDHQYRQPKQARHDEAHGRRAHAHRAEHCQNASRD